MAASLNDYNTHDWEYPAAKPYLFDRMAKQIFPCSINKQVERPHVLFKTPVIKPMAKNCE